MQKLGWVTESGGFWERDISTPLTLDGVARPAMAGVGGGASRGARLSRPKQLHFFHQFMFAPFLPSYSHAAGGFSLQRLLTLPSPHESWFGTLVGEFNLQKFVSSIVKTSNVGPTPQKLPNSSSWLQTIRTKLSDKSFYSLNFCSELLLTPDDTFLFSVEKNGTDETSWKKAVLHHKFQNHNLTLEAAWPQLFVDHVGTYWDVPFSMAADLSSVASDIGACYHFSINHNQGTPKPHENWVESEKLATLHSGLCAKSAFALKRSIDIWRSGAPKLKLVQPYDIFLSTPHITASGIVGVVLTACQGGNAGTSQVEEYSKVFRGLTVCAPGLNSKISADTFGSILFSAQHGNFQRLILDLTRVHARLDFPSGSKFLSGAAFVAQDLYTSKQPSVDVLQAMCPKATVSFQQQIVGPFSFRVDSGVSLDLKNNRCGGPHICVNDPVFAIEYALQVLGSAKAVAWYSPKQQEFMVELRFFET